MDERKRKSKVMKTSRFSEEQIRYLESMFEKETRVEPRKKVEVARELGLQPRQVAIWFQNKRARWRSKQLETEYAMLRASFNTLASRFGVLNKEKQALLLQLQKLSDELQESENGNRNNIEFEDDMKADYFGVGVEQEWGNMEFNHFSSSSSNSYQWWESIV